MYSVATPHFTLDAVGPEANEDLCRLFREVHVRGALDLNQERDPDYAALQRLQGDSGVTFLAREPDGRPAALGSVVVRDAWLDGERVRAGYLCDLRVRPGFRGGVLLAREFDRALAHVEATTGAEVYTTVVFDDNRLARAVLTGRSAERRGQPAYRPMTPFVMRSIQFTRRRAAPDAVGSRAVRPATSADLDELVAFLTRRGRARVHGEDFSDGLLSRRLAAWPGFALDDFLLAHAGGRIVGCCAPWDTAPVKRTRVLGYHGAMAWVRAAFNAGALIGRWPPLPPAGECLRFAFLTHLEVENDDPVVLRALITAAYARTYDRRLHFLAAFVPRGLGAVLDDAFAGFTVRDTAMTLYAVTRRGSPHAAREWGTVHPGFEMALS